MCILFFPLPSLSGGAGSCERCTWPVRARRRRRALSGTAVCARTVVFLVGFCPMWFCLAGVGYLVAGWGCSGWVGAFCAAWAAPRAQPRWVQCCCNPQTFLPYLAFLPLAALCWGGDAGSPFSAKPVRPGRGSGCHGGLGISQCSRHGGFAGTLAPQPLGAVLQHTRGSRGHSVGRVARPPPEWQDAQLWGWSLEAR